jgi:hypothetical protein
MSLQVSAAHRLTGVIAPARTYYVVAANYRMRRDGWQHPLEGIHVHRMQQDHRTTCNLADPLGARKVAFVGWGQDKDRDRETERDRERYRHRH